MVQSSFKALFSVCVVLMLVSQVFAGNELKDDVSYSFDIFKSQDSLYLEIQVETDLNFSEREFISVQINESQELILFLRAPILISLNKFDTKLIFVRIREPHDQMKLFYISESNDGYKLVNIPLWLTILPPVIAILLAMIFREVIVALFAGVWMGAFLALGLRMDNILNAFLHVIDKYILQAMTSTGHISVIIFSIMIGGMVAVISKNGSMAGVIHVLSKWARSARDSQLTTWAMGLVVFFDDYANSLIVGNTMKPLTDKYKVSREKLAYIIDSTAAPVAAVAFVTTWIGAELGYIEDGTRGLNIEAGAYELFLSSLKYSYYPFLTLLFIFMIIMMKRAYGPMLKAEKKALSKPPIEVKEEATQSKTSLPHRAHWINAAVPVLALVGVTITGLIATGNQGIDWNTHDVGFFKKLSMILGNADSYKALLWGSLCGTGIAIFLTVTQKLLTLGKSLAAMLEGFKTMLPAILILILAWALAGTIQELHTADFMASWLSGNVSIYILPAFTFALAAAVAFATGSSWGTMAILYPLMLPASWIMANASGMGGAEQMDIFTSIISVILAGAVFGDHCSPISDTTILSSLASECNHIDHVRTQLPYALTVAAISFLLLILVSFLPIPWWAMFPIGIAAMYMAIRLFGKPVQA